ncbi:MAG TPA: TraR/DksA family transcriptional regulator [Microbacterium sp.]|nr:TraR/DksA family transcriptional regulator [Microbacterium sp.]
MDEELRSEFRALIAERREEALRALERGRDGLEEVGRARSAATADDEHDPEGATLAEEWSRVAGRNAAAEAELRAVDEAAARLADGTYGVCARCGERIPADRLRARPTATMCVSCASKR